MKKENNATPRKYVPMDYLETLHSLEESAIGNRINNKSYIYKKMKEMKFLSDGDSSFYLPYFDFEGNLTNVKQTRFMLGKKEIYMGNSSFVFDISDGYIPCFLNENSIFKRSKKLLPPKSEPILITVDEFTSVIGSAIYPSMLWIATGTAELTEYQANFILATGRDCVFIYDKAELPHVRRCKEFLADHGINAKLKSINQSGFPRQLFFFKRLEG
jgi:hypothetical protein